MLQQILPDGGEIVCGGEAFAVGTAAQAIGDLADQAVDDRV